MFVRNSTRKGVLSMEIKQLYDDISDKLRAHEYNAQNRAEWLANEINKLNRGEKMSETVNDRVNVHLGGQDGGMAALAPLLAAQGGGMGQNGMLPLLLLALLGRGNGGLFGGGNDGGSGVNNIQSTIESGNIMSALGDIKASVPLAEAQVQLALAGAQNDINNQTQAQTIQLLNQNFMGQIANQQAFCTTQREIAETACAVKQTVNDDGEKTRSLIGAIDRENLNRQIQVLANEVTELRNDNRRTVGENGIRIDMTNNQNQLQMQQQQQAQAINGIAHLLADSVQIARATNQAINIGGGTLTSNPTNTATNLRT
jgi:hypothetical protein